MSNEKRSIIRAIGALALLFALAIVMGGVAEAAGYKVIDELSGINYNIKGSRGGYNAELAIPSDGKVDLKVRADFSGTGTGSKISWKSKPAESTSSSAQCDVVPSGYTELSESYHEATFKFSNVSTGDHFVLTALLCNDKNESIAAEARIDVTFVDPVPLTGVKLNKNEFTLRQSILNESAHIIASPVPNNATNVKYRWDQDDEGYYVNLYNEGLQNVRRIGVASSAKTKDTAKITVTATGENGTTATASCTVTVVGAGDVADDMVIDPQQGSESQEKFEVDKSTTTLLGTDETFIKASDFFKDGTEQLTPELIKSGSGLDGKVRYLIGKKDKVTAASIDVARANIASSLSIPDYTTRVVSAQEFDINVGANDMVPMLMQFNFPDNLKYPAAEPTLVTRPTNTTEFHNNFRVMKYFDKDNSVDLSNFLHGKMGGTNYVRQDEVTGARGFRLTPLIVLVNSMAPKTGSGTPFCDQYLGANDKYGIRFDEKHKVLYIYDGYSDDRLQDPIVLEKRPVQRSGGGGGGCATGAALALAMFAAFAIKRRSR